MKIIFLYKIL